MLLRNVLVYWGAASFFCFSALASSVQNFQFKNGATVLTFEILNDQLLHFAYSPLASPENQVGNQTDRIPTTLFISRTEFQGSPSAHGDASGFVTQATQVEVNPETLCFSITDLHQHSNLGVKLTEVCPSVSNNGYGLTLEKDQIENIYGLGEQFQSLGNSNHDWMGRVRTPANQYGNGMNRFGGGGLGNNQFPILYALGPDTVGFALYLDTVYALQWDFTKPLWKIDRTHSGSDPSLRGYIFLGDDLPSLRTQFMDLVGRPPVPPKKAFGLWVSEFGYRNWKEIEKKLNGLRADHFPVDGFVSDVYWFGGYTSNSPESPMGRLDWDLKHFPNPEKELSKFEQDGVGLMLIEESYISKGLANYTSMADRGFLTRNGCATCEPTLYNAWWGQGSGIDWTNPAAGAAWHNEHRKKLTDIGITFHWTDLGEPENWTDQNIYNGGKSEADSHNTYNFLWHKSIFDGYAANQEAKRHFILSRSGSTGMQRLGSAMWSGDIGSNLPSLASHLNVQMNMSLSGMDYFGADVGGFTRLALEGSVDEVYTKWLAHAVLFDVPVRPHTDNGTRKNETAPNRIGDVASNLFNLRQRYELAPYYYSLAYLAYQSGEPLVPPLVYYYQTDPNVRLIADEKMIGRDLLAATAAHLGETSRSVYLPSGAWIDYHTLTSYQSEGQWFQDIELNQDGAFRLPLFARAGAILPKAHIDEQTMNILGQRTDGSLIQDLSVEVFSSPNATVFTLYEDDGVTESYRQGSFAQTRISQTQSSDKAEVIITATQGSYSGAPTKRANQIELVLANRRVTRVTLNGQSVPFKIDSRGVVIAKSGLLDVLQPKIFDFYF